MLKGFQEGHSRRPIDSQVGHFRMPTGSQEARSRTDSGTGRSRTGSGAGRSRIRTGSGAGRSRIRTARGPLSLGRSRTALEPLSLEGQLQTPLEPLLPGPPCFAPAAADLQCNGELTPRDSRHGSYA